MLYVAPYEINAVITRIPTMSDVYWEEHARRTVLQGRKALERTAESLARSQAIAVETEEIGNSVLAELGEQRETLERSRQRLESTDIGLSRSKSILRTMSVRAVTNKIILVFIILFEVCILSGLVYLKFFRK